MALLPSTNTVTAFTGEVMAQFNYFSRPITVYKQPQETIVNNLNLNPLFGYSPLSQTTNSNITLAAQSQIFSGLVLYPLKSRGSSTAIFDNKLLLEDNKTYLKVLSACSDYINNGTKTEKVEVDGGTWNIEGNAQIGRFLGLQFYYYQIKATT
jgi:hypothetical protein